MTTVEDHFDTAIKPTIDYLVATAASKGFDTAEMSVLLSLAFSELSIHVNRYMLAAQRNHERGNEPMRMELAELMQRKACEVADEIRNSATLMEGGFQ